jgi:hypothetical protein
MWRVILISFLISACSRSSEFDRARWLKADLNGRERAEMVPSLLRKHPLLGLKREEVVALLGHPTPPSGSNRDDMIYCLGNDGTMFAIDNEWLEIRLDGSGKVAAYTRTKD